MSETTVGKKKASRFSKLAPWLAGLALIGLFVGFYVIVIMPPLLQAQRVTRISSVFENTQPAVIKAIEYAHDKGVYPTSLRVLTEEGYIGVIRDKDPWGNDWVLSRLLTEGRTPREGDDVYIYSRGPKGTGVYPEPFTDNTGPDGAIGYSSLHGTFGSWK